MARPLLLVVALVPLLSAAPPASGQGTSGALPDPISGRDLSAYARRLGLSASQRLAVDADHERYLADFRALRDDEIAKYLDEAGSLMRSFFSSPDSRQARKNLKELERLMGRIRSYDARLFDAMQAILTEDQLARLARVRQMRERARNRAGLVRFVEYANAGARVDLSRLMDGLDLRVETRNEVDPILAAYEGELTRASRRLFDETRRMFTEVLEEMEKLTGGADPREDPRVARRLWSGMRDIWIQKGEGVMAQASGMSSLNRRTFRDLALAMPEEEARALQNAYYERAYRRMHEGAAKALAPFDAALRTALPPARREAVETARADFRERHDRLSDPMIDLLEAQRREATAMRFGGRGARPGEEQLERLGERREELDERGRDELASILGEEALEELEEKIAKGEADGPASVAIAVVGANGGGHAGAVTNVRVAAAPAVDAAEAVGPPAGPDPWVPGPISAAELATYGRLLAIGDDERSVLESLHAGYLDRYEALGPTHFEPLAAASRTLWALEEKTGRIEAPTLDEIERLYELRRAAFDAVRAVDDSLLGDVELIATGDDVAAGMERVRFARMRVVYNRGGEGGGGIEFGRGRRMMRGMRSRSSEERIDLAMLLEAGSLGADDQASVDEPLAAYEERLANGLERRYELALEYELASDRIGAEAAANREPGERRRPAMFGSAYRTLSETTGRELRDAGSALVELNRTTLETLTAALSADPARALRTAYRRRAHPSVYNDARAAEPFLRAALAREDLTNDQRLRVSDVLDDYVEPYANLSDRMATLRAAASDDERRGWRNRDWSRLQERRNELDRLRFDRDELNDRTLRRLRAILNEEQAVALGLPAEE
jgi:hypothetical protein